MQNIRFLVPNIITSLALACGVIAIARAMTGDPLAATWWVLYATLLDRVDGAVARALEASSDLGGWLDSFSDFVAFGLAPAFVFFGACGRGYDPVLLLPMIFYIIGCAVRLANFGLKKGGGAGYQGVPSTMAGGVYAVGLNVAASHGFAPADHVGAFAVALVLFGAAMNAPWLRYARLGAQSTRWLRYVVLVLIAICAVFIVSRRYPEFLLAVSGSAMVFGPIITALDQPRAEVTPESSQSH